MTSENHDKIPCEKTDARRTLSVYCICQAPALASQIVEKVAEWLKEVFKIEESEEQEQEEKEK